MFTQKINMDCTKEQYEKYLKAELEKMGYKETCMSGWKKCAGIVNNLRGFDSAVSNVMSTYYTDRGRTYLGSFNAPLFLALAAMTDDFGYGEWSVLESGAFVRRQDKGKGYGYENGGRVEDGAIFRHLKASTEEIKAHFTQADKLNTEPQKPISKGSVTFDVKLDTTGLEEQLDQFSKRFEAKIKEETLTAYLDKVIKDLEEMLKANPKYNEPIVGEMAIFWDTNKSNALCTVFDIYKCGEYYSGNAHWQHAILYKSPEQYKAFLKS